MEKVLYFDVETTGLDPRRHGLIQLGQIIEVDGKIVSQDSWNIQPFKQDEITDKALEIIGTKRDELFDNTKRLRPDAVCFEIKRTWDAVIDKYDRTDKFILAGYNVDSFDQQFLREFVRKCTPMERFNIAGSYIGHMTMDPLPYLKWLKVLGILSINNLKLQTVCEHLGIILTDAHDAMADIQATRWLIKRVRRQLEQWVAFTALLDDAIRDGDAEGNVVKLNEPMEDEPQSIARPEKPPSEHIGDADKLPPKPPPERRRDTGIF